MDARVIGLPVPCARAVSCLEGRASRHSETRGFPNFPKHDVSHIKMTSVRSGFVRMQDI